MKSIYLFFTLFCVSIYSLSETEIVYPWVTNNSLFQAKVVINNLNNAEVNIQLVATRPSGETETVTLSIGPFGQFVSDSNSLFPELGTGAGYSVFLSSPADGIEGAFVVSGTDSSSGSSPAQANVVPASSASNLLMFNYLPIPENPPADSAPVVVNMGTSAASVTFHGYQGGQKVGTFNTMIAVRTPFAQVTSSMFPSTTGDIYVVAESDQPILGLAFIFNDFREPSMANTTAASSVPDPNGAGTVSFSNDVMAIFTNSCLGCHGNGSSSGGLNLAPENAYGNLVNVPSVLEPSFMLVLPSDADNSYLYRRLNPSLTSGHYIQPTEAELNTIRDWINEGAANN